MQRLQVHKSAEALGSAVCEAALEVTSGRSALLIRWLPQDAYGLVQYASRELALETGMIIGKDTLVGRTCRDGMPLLLHDARAVTRSEPAYTATLAYRPIPSLVVVPIVWRAARDRRDRRRGRRAGRASASRRRATSGFLPASLARSSRRSGRSRR